jgi:hypothetical protein
MFTYNGSIVDGGFTVGLYTVRFFNTYGLPVSVQVDTELPSGGQFYDHVSNALGTRALWAALAEKAYAEANGIGWVTTNHELVDSYGALDYGDAAWALHAITGHTVTDQSISANGALVMMTAPGGLVVIGTPTDFEVDPLLMANHAYAVVAYNGSSASPYEVFNPYGTDTSGWAPGHANQKYGLFWASGGFLQLCFTDMSNGFGGTPGTDGSAGDSHNGRAAGTALATTPLWIAANDFAPRSQATALGIDPGSNSLAGDGDDPVTSGFGGPRQCFVQHDRVPDASRARLNLQPDSPTRSAGIGRSAAAIRIIENPTLFSLPAVQHAAVACPSDPSAGKR